MLRGGAVHVWRADLSAVEQELCALLSSDERERAERILGAAQRHTWARSRALLRVLLGRYLQRDPREVHLAREAQGKPRLVRGGPSGAPPTRPQEDLRFSLSHSGQIALYAFARSVAVGVDIESSTSSRVDEAAIAARALGRATAERIASLSGAARRVEFLRAWAREEAELKCLGTGFGAAQPRTLRTPIWSTQLPVGQDAAAALAVTQRPRAVCCWEWEA